MLPPLHRTALVELLKNARRQSNLSIRRAAALAKVPPSTVQGWFEGRHLPTPALMPHFLELLEAMDVLDSAAERTAWTDAVARLRNTAPVATSPYVGLRSYTAAESAVFMGRERAYGSLVQACTAEARPDGPLIVVVVGDSGSGKSSLLAAGLMGRACAPDGPLRHLEPVAVNVAALPRYVAGDTPTLLVVDQFEDAERLSNADQVAVFDALAGLPEHITCVVALTTAAFGFALRDERLAPRLAAPVLVGPLTADEYTRIIEEPAQLHGRRVSPTLTQLMLRDMRQYGDPSPGVVLPLLSNALRRCWATASGDILGTGDYLNAGGLWSALNDEAESVYGSFTPEQQHIVRRLMLSLVQLDGVTILRSTLPVVSLPSEMTPLVEGFVAARLLTRKDGHVAISHDALLSRWGRLSQWVEQEKASLLIGRRIHMAAQLWQDGGRSTDALMPVEAVLWKEWAQSLSAMLLTDGEHEFIDASLALADASNQEQRQTVARMRRRQHLSVVAALVAMALVASTVLSTLRSEGFRNDAEAATLSAQARQVALIADEMRPNAPNVAAQLSVAALALDDSVQTRSAVVKSAGMTTPTRTKGPTGNTMVARSPGQPLIARGSSDGIITLWRDGTLTSVPATVDSGGGHLFALKIATVQGRTLAIVGGQRTAAIWDLTDDPRKLADFGQDTVTYSAAWQDSTAVFGTLEGEIRRVDCSDPSAPTPLQTLRLGEKTAVTGLAAAGDEILAGGIKNRIDIFNTAHLTQGSVEMHGTALSMDASPDGNEVLVGSAMPEATLWRSGPGGWESLHTFDTPSSVTAVRHLGEHLFIAGAFGEVLEFDGDRKLTATRPSRAVVTSIDASPDSVLVGSSEGNTLLWPADTNTTIFTAPEGAAMYGLRGTPDALMVGTSAGAELFTVGNDGWRPIPKSAPPPGTTYTGHYGMSGDGSVLVNQTSTGDLVTLEATPNGYRSVGSQKLPELLMSDVMVSETGRFIALGYPGKPEYLLMVREGTLWVDVATVTAWPSGCNFSRDESTFVAIDEDGKAFVLWQLLDGPPHRVVTVDMADDVTPIHFDFSPEGNLAVGDSEGAVTVFSMQDPNRPQIRQRLPDARSSLSQLHYSADGKRLLASTREGQLWVWDEHDDGFHLSLQLRPQAASITGADSFGDSLVMSLDDGRVIAWPDDANVAAATLCHHFGTPLSEQEWSQIVPGVDFVNGC